MTSKLEKIKKEVEKMLWKREVRPQEWFSKGIELAIKLTAKEILRSIDFDKWFEEWLLSEDRMKNGTIRKGFKDFLKKKLDNLKKEWNVKDG